MEQLPESTYSRWRGFALLLVIWVASLGLVEFLIRSRTSHQALTLADDLGRVAIRVLAAGSIFWRARHAPGVFIPFWKTLGLAISILAATTIYGLVTRDLLALPAPIPTFRYLGYLAGLGCLGYAAIKLPVQSILPSQRAQAFLDGILISSAIFFLAWGTFLRRLVETNASNDSAWGLTLVFPFLATALGSLWMFQEVRLKERSLGRAGLFLRLGMGVMVIWWTLYAFSNIQGWYRTSHLGARMDMIPSLGVLMFGLGALWPERPACPKAPNLEGHRWDRQHILLYLPSSVALIYGAGALARGATFDVTMVVAGTVLGAVLTIRQFLTIRDLDNLSAELDRRVQERTRDLVRNQQELAKAQRSQIIAGMAAGFAHDFKNQLNVIQNWVELLRMDEVPPDLPEGLSAIKKATIQALGLVQGILAAGRLQELSPETFELGQFLQRLRPSLAGALGNRATLELVLAEDGLIVHMDPEKFGGALLNLASNAADAMEGGTLTLAARKDPVEPFVVLDVSDTGRGISEEHLERIFEPFFTTKPTGKGTGLGLSSVYGTILQSGGTITVESRLGVGTTFTLLLPQQPGKS